MTYNDNINNKTIKMYIPSPTSYPNCTVNNVANERTLFVRMLRSFLGSCLPISFSMLLVLSVIAFKCTEQDKIK